MNILKKSILTLGLVVTCVTGFAQASGTPIYREESFLNGWNVAITNGVTIGPNLTTNVLFTLNNGQIVYSQTNQNINGVVITNQITVDWCNGNGLEISPDMLGDFVQNSHIHLLLNNTNLIPIAATNSQGQWFTIQAGYTGFVGFQGGGITNYTGWPLANSAYPIYQYPATTNLYTGYYPNNNSTNNLTFYFQGGWKLPINGGGQNQYTVWDQNTNAFAFTWNGALVTYGNVTNGQAAAFATNLPATFLQRYNRVRLAGVTCATGSGPLGGYVINALSLGQPRP